MSVRSYAGLLCDLDGTVYLDGRPLPGVPEALDRLRSGGVSVLFVSNNPHRDSAAYAERLTGLGIAAEPAEVLTSGGVLCEWLSEHQPNGRAFVLGEESLRVELERSGLKVVDSGAEADVVVASFDRTFDYAKWIEAFNALRAGARFVATNPDVTCPVEGGEIPDCGGIIAALEASSGRRVEQVAGKPSTLMVEAALKRVGLGREQLLVIGDRLQTDIAMGERGGVATALVCTGVTRREDVAGSGVTPTHIVESLAELPMLLGVSG